MTAFLLVLLQNNSSGFLEKWHQSSLTALGFFWMALWAFILGYFISSMIQVFVTKERMRKSMGETGAKSVGLGTFFGFISSSCSFAALATTRSLFQKGAGFIPSLAFLLASTNLVVELGIVIFIFLGWQFMAAEYIGGILLILFMWLFVKITYPENLVQKAKEKLDEQGGTESEDQGNWKKKIKSSKAWNRVGSRYLMEWNMVWKDVSIGFTVAGIVAVFIPSSFYETLFIGIGEQSGNYSFLQLVEHVLIGPVVAFFTFIGSMGNIPLAAVLYENGVSFAGIMAFIFSDLVVFPVLRINAKYYGWKMSFYILLTLLFSLVVSALLLHYGFDIAGFLPEGSSGQGLSEQNHFQIDYTFYLNMVFLLISAGLVWLSYRSDSHGNGQMGKSGLEVILKYVAILAYLWLAAGLAVRLFI